LKIGRLTLLTIVVLFGFLFCSLINASGTLTVTVMMSKTSYPANEEIILWGHLTHSNSPVPDWLVAIEIRNPINDTIVTRTRRTNGSGIYELVFQLSQAAILGTYTVHVSSSYLGETAMNTTSFEFGVRVEIPIKGGENATITASVEITNAHVAKNTLHFDVSGPTGSTGWVNVTFPMVNTTEIKVFINKEKLTPPPFPTIITNGTHYLIYFEFTLSTHTISLQFGILGDLDGNGVVDIFDALALAGVFGLEEGDPNWNPDADLVEDGVIDIFDALVFAANFGEGGT